MEQSRTIYMRAMTAIHAGAGQDTGVVDMPIQREITTGIPKIEASVLKGCFREIFEEKYFEEKYHDILFGKDNKAGIIGLTDARLLFFPVKSARGIFALITCPFALERYLEEIGENQDEVKELIKKLDNKINFVTNDKCYLVNDKLSINKEIVMLDEYIFTAEILEIDSLDKYKKLTPYIENIAIVSDDNFFDFVANHTEIVTRNKIDNSTGTAADKGLFTVEYLPQESILYTIAVGFKAINSNEPKQDYFNNVFGKEIKGRKIQIGGNKTLGKGFIKILSEEAN